MIPLKCVFYLYPDSPKSSPRNQANRQRAATLPTHRDGLAKESTPKHDIVVVADGQTILKGITQSYFIYIYILLSLNTTLFYIVFQTFVHVHHVLKLIYTPYCVTKKWCILPSLLYLTEIGLLCRVMQKGTFWVSNVKAR